MALDVVLAVSLMWVAQDGEMKSSPVRGTYPSMAACALALNDQIDTLAKLTGATPVASGDLCLPRVAATAPALPRALPGKLAEAGS